MRFGRASSHPTGDLRPDCAWAGDVCRAGGESGAARCVIAPRGSTTRPVRPGYGRSDRRHLDPVPLEFLLRRSVLERDLEPGVACRVVGLPEREAAGAVTVSHTVEQRLQARSFSFNQLTLPRWPRREIDRSHGEPHGVRPCPSGDAVPRALHRHVLRVDPPDRYRTRGGRQRSPGLRFILHLVVPVGGRPEGRLSFRAPSPRLFGRWRTGNLEQVLGSVVVDVSEQKPVLAPFVDCVD